MGKPVLTKCLIARCAPGLEQMVTEEFHALGYRSAKMVRPGRVGLAKTESSRRAVMMSNLWLRTANRVTFEVGRFKASDFGTLYNGIRNIHWPRYIDIEKNFVVVHASSRASKLFHTKAIEERVREAIKKSLGEADDPVAITTVYVEMEKDTCALSIDTTGEPLEHRGWRNSFFSDETSPTENGVVKAPLKATAAAALLNLAGWPKAVSGSPDEKEEQSLLGDPFSGSGTIVMEAATMALGIAPGLNRTFAFESFPQFKEEEWKELVARGSKRRRKFSRILARGTDRDEGAVELARLAAKEGGLEDVVQFELKPVSAAFEDGPSPTCIVTNPPHFRRLKSGRDPRNLFASLGTMLKDRLNTGTPCTFLLASPEGLLNNKSKNASNKQLLGQLGFPTKYVSLFGNGGNSTYVYTGQSKTS